MHGRTMLYLHSWGVCGWPLIVAGNAVIGQLILVLAAQRLIDQHPQDVRRDDLAQQLGCSAATLSRRFQTYTSKSLTAYRNHVRLIKALHDLEHNSAGGIPRRSAQSPLNV